MGQSNGDETMPLMNGTEDAAAEPVGLAFVMRRKRRRSLLFAAAGIIVFSFITMLLFIPKKKDHKDEPAAAAAKATESDAHPGILSVPSSPDIPSGCETTVLLMRHCDDYGPGRYDDVDNEHCSYVGFERSRYIADELFGPKQRWPIPSVVYTSTLARVDHYNFRFVETLEPLVDKYDLDYHAYETTEPLAEDFLERLRSGEMCGKVTLVIWKHSLMNELCNSLGGSFCPDEYPSESFDQVWALKYVYDPIHSPAIGHSRLRHSDQPHPNHVASHDTKGEESKRWYTFTTVTQQGFDPLAYSAKFGDYGAANEEVPPPPPFEEGLHGMPVGGGWVMSEEDEHEEI
eukprot:CAMPEP_0198116300 /NCGR_PEP_ID=MMETSP1442-20131203/11197_1 /TAXON_ID= /ORGANISM="Craspedostauros australis, Strain CCMP3328" /LENGTH=344 /DNA_ID=CAMNT_0043774083 /DNA_START=42 /DNA_END=1076 /DNA_ORIENTATION=+